MYRQVFGTMAEAVHLAITRSCAVKKPARVDDDDDDELMRIFGEGCGGGEVGDINSEGDSSDSGGGEDDYDYSTGSPLSELPPTPATSDSRDAEERALRREQLRRIIQNTTGNKRSKQRKRGGTRHPGEVVGSSGGAFTEAVSRNTNKPYQVVQAIATLQRALDADSQLADELMEIVLLMLFGGYETRGVVYLDWDSRRALYRNVLLCPPTPSDTSRWLLRNFVVVRAALRAWVAFCADEMPAVEAVVRRRYDWDTYVAVTELTVDALLVRVRTLGTDTLLEGLHESHASVATGDSGQPVAAAEMRPLLPSLAGRIVQSHFVTTPVSDYDTLRDMCGGVFARIPVTLPSHIVRRLSRTGTAVRLPPGETVMLSGSSARRRTAKRSRTAGADPTRVGEAVAVSMYAAKNQALGAGIAVPPTSNVVVAPDGRTVTTELLRDGVVVTAATITVPTLRAPNTDDRGYKLTTATEFGAAADSVIQKVYYRVRHGAFWEVCLAAALRIDALRRLEAQLPPQARAPAARIVRHRVPAFEPDSVDPIERDDAYEELDDWPRGKLEPAWRTLGEEPRWEYGSHPIVFALERLGRRVFADRLARDADTLLLVGVSPRAVDAINAARTAYECSAQKSAPFRFLIEVLDRFEFGALVHFLKAQARRLQLRFAPLPAQNVREQLDSLRAAGGYSSYADIPRNASVVYFCRGCASFATGVYTPLDRRQCNLTSVATGATNCNLDPGTLHMYCRNGDRLTSHQGTGPATLPSFTPRVTVAALSQAASAALYTREGGGDEAGAAAAAADSSVDQYEFAANEAMQTTLESARRKAARPDVCVATLLRLDADAVCYNEPMVPVSLVGHSVRVTGQHHVCGTSAPAAPTGEVYILCPCTGARLHLAHFHPDVMIGTTYRCVWATIRTIARTAQHGPALNEAPTLYTLTRAAPDAARDLPSVFVGDSGGCGGGGGDGGGAATAPPWVACMRCTVPTRTDAATSKRVRCIADTDGLIRCASNARMDAGVARRAAEALDGYLVALHLCNACAVGRAWMMGSDALYTLSVLLRGISDGIRTRTLITDDGTRLDMAVPRSGARQGPAERRHWARLDRIELNDPQKRARARLRAMKDELRRRSRANKPKPRRGGGAPRKRKSPSRPMERAPRRRPAPRKRRAMLMGSDAGAAAAIAAVAVATGPIELIGEHGTARLDAIFTNTEPLAVAAQEAEIAAAVATRSRGPKRRAPSPGAAGAGGGMAADDFSDFE